MEGVQIAQGGSSVDLQALMLLPVLVRCHGKQVV